MAGGKCSHGYVPGDGPAITVRGGRERKADEHEKQCHGARLFNHAALLGKVVCCATCGRRVC